MSIKPIRSEQDYQNALKKIDILMHRSAPDASDQIEVLTAVIEKYEREHFAVEAPTPIEAIRFRMDQKGLSPRDLEPFIGSRSRVSEVLSGKRNLSLDMIRALHEGLGIPYDSLIAKSAPKAFDGLTVKLPVLRKLNEIGFSMKLEEVGAFLQRAFGKSALPALNRKTRTQRASGKTDEAALLLWQAAVLQKARAVHLRATFDPDDLDEDVLREIAQLSRKDDGPRLAREELAQRGIRLVFVPLFPGTFLDGAVMLLDGREPVIGLTLRHDRVDNFWFTLLHELSHLARHLERLQDQGNVIFDELDVESDDVIEKEADTLASESLIPAACARKLAKPFCSRNCVEEVAEVSGVHVSIAAGRWQHTHKDYKKFARMIERNVVRDMVGYD